MLKKPSLTTGKTLYSPGFYAGAKSLKGIRQKHTCIPVLSALLRSPAAPSPRSPHSPNSPQCPGILRTPEAAPRAPEGCTARLGAVTSPSPGRSKQQGARGKPGSTLCSGRWAHHTLPLQGGSFLAGTDPWPCPGSPLWAGLFNP